MSSTSLCRQNSVSRSRNRSDSESALLDGDTVDYLIDDAPVVETVSTAAAAAIPTPVVMLTGVTPRLEPEFASPAYSQPD